MKTVDEDEDVGAGAAGPIACAEDARLELSTGWPRPSEIFNMISLFITEIHNFQILECHEQTDLVKL